LWSEHAKNSATTPDQTATTATDKSLRACPEIYSEKLYGVVFAGVSCRKLARKLFELRRKVRKCQHLASASKRAAHAIPSANLKDAAAAAVAAAAAADEAAQELGSVMTAISSVEEAVREAVRPAESIREVLAEVENQGPSSEPPGYGSAAY
jgi:hypothetical protein